VGGKSWHGGVTYVEALVQSLRKLPKDQQPRVHLIVDRANAADLSAHLYFADMIDSVIAVGDVPAMSNDHGVSAVHVARHRELVKHIDFIFPVNTDVMPGFCHASWIPDFQHRYLPELFREDWAWRESAIKDVLEVGRLIVVSSETAKKDLQNLYGDSGERVRVLPFHTAVSSTWFEADPTLIAAKYGLSGKYVICCNQFWQHKNHDTLLKALARTKGRIDLVCTGAEKDYRNMDWFSAINKLIDELAIRSQVSLLGFIPRVDQIQLMRCAVAVVQPSLHEGWSTVLEDARALGKPILASDLDVHKEQAIPGALYFDPHDADELALKLDQACSSFEPGPNRVTEQVAQREVSYKQEMAGRKLMEIAEEAVTLFSTSDFRNGVTLRAVEKILTERLKLSEAARVVRLEQLDTIRVQLEISEADRAARLDVIERLDAQVKQLEKQLEISEADRAARLDVIERLDARVKQLEKTRHRDK
jgi:glycosyltransferase involved in cell wall biosynthesis